MKQALKLSSPMWPMLGSPLYVEKPNSDMAGRSAAPGTERGRQRMLRDYLRASGVAQGLGERGTAQLQDPEPAWMPQPRSEPWSGRVR